MKQVINASIGGLSFCMEEDAYNRLSQYLENFKASLANDGNASDGSYSQEIISDIESRIAELLTARMTNSACTVSLDCINSITAQLGMPDGSCEPAFRQTADETGRSHGPFTVIRKLFRDTEDKIIGGVCAGLGHYMGCDKTVIRVVFIVLAVLSLSFKFRNFSYTFSYSFGIGMLSPILYLILWIVIPNAKTPAEKCAMRGLPATAENMRKFK